MSIRNKTMNTLIDSMAKHLKGNFKNIIISEYMKNRYNLTNMQYKMSDIWMSKTFLSELIQAYHRKAWLNAFIDR